MAPRNDLAKTWWSKQWIHALETRALRDPNRLPRGRTYARRGAVIDLEIDEGQITAEVKGSRARPYKITIGIRRFRPEEWDSLFEVIGSQVGFTADLLAGVVPHELVADAAHRGVELLPEAGDLSMNCSCPDWAVPCKHLAAVCYMTAAALDDDPFQILRLRGRSRTEVEEQLQAQRSAAATPAAAAQRTVELAATLWNEPDADVDVFASIGRGNRGEGGSLPVVLHRWAAIGANSDGQIAADIADAARRAALNLAEGKPTHTSITPLADAARRAASAASGAERAAIAQQMKVTVARLDALAASWINAGHDGVRVADALNGVPLADWPTIDPVLRDVARQVLADSGVKVRSSPAWFELTGSKVRIIFDPTPIDASDQPRFSTGSWFAVAQRGRYRHVLGSAPLEEIAELVT